MDRLTLSSRPKTAEREKCLPAGDGLPFWSEVPLFAKLPVYPTPKGSYKLCTTSLCEPKHKTTRFDFDLTDPCGHFAFSEYEPLHDPHLRHHFSVPRMRRHLVRNGFLYNGKVVCDLKEFNKYRQYLRKMFLMEMESERHEQQCMVDSRKSVSCELQDSNTKKRLEIVRKKLEEMSKIRRKKYEIGLEDKKRRVQKRREELNIDRSIRETRNKFLEKKRKHTLQQHKEMIEKRNQLLIRRWKTEERRRQRRLREVKQKQLMDYRQKIKDSWEARKRNQTERLERETTAMQRLEKTMNQSIAEREKNVNAHRQRLQEGLADLRDRMKKKQEETERKHARRLAERLALADIRNMARRNARRRGRKPQYYSMWGIVSSLRRMEMSDIKVQKSARFLEMLNHAYDEISIFIDESAADELGETNEDELYRIKAREIVMDVYDRVRMGYCSQRSDEHITFRERPSIIPLGSDTSVPCKELKSVREHIVTPVPSTYELQVLKLEDEHEQERKKIEDIKLAETLLTNLLNNLNNESIEREDIIKLTQYCMEIVQKRDYAMAVEEDIAVTNLNEYQISGIADSLVKFTLQHIIEDIKTGQLSHEDLTRLTMSIIGDEKIQDDTETDSVPDNEIDKFVESTLQDIIQDKEFQVESPVNDAMLDDFIIKTLTTLAEDVLNSRLSKEMIEEMLSLMTAEISCNLKLETSDLSFKPLLQKIIENLEGEQTNSLYRIVHAFVSSYLNFKESSQESLEEVVVLVIDKMKQEFNDNTAEIECLTKLAEEMSSQSLSTTQMAGIANDISAASSFTEANKLIVEEAIERAKTVVMSVDSDGLKRIASKLASSIDSVLHDLHTDKYTRPFQFASKVSKFVTDVLKLVFQTLQKGQFTESDIEEMTRTVHAHADSRENKIVVLTNYIKTLITEVSSGSTDLKHLEATGLELISCGKKLLSISVSSEAPICAAIRTSSFTSTAVAHDLVGHLLESLQTELHKETVSKEYLKELTLCILRTTTSSSSISSMSISRKSPSDSTIAEEVVRSVLGNIVKDIDDGRLDRISIVSIASSAVSLFSDDLDRKETIDIVMRNIISRLREDKLSMEEAKYIFKVVLRKYRYEPVVMFPREGPVSADSELAESLIRETIIKIDREIRSGHFSDDDLQIFADESKRSQRRRVPPNDVINLVISIIEHLKSQVSSSDTDDVLTFLNIICTDSECIITTSTEMMQVLNGIIDDIGINRHLSQYFKRFLRQFVSRRANETETAAMVNILQTMDVSVLSNFVKSTVADVLSDVRKTRMQSSVSLPIDMSGSDTGVLLQTASSLVANNLVNNLISRIEKTLMAGKALSSDTELAELHTENEDAQRYMGPLANIEADFLCKISSEEIGAHILETLNNIISNMRLERSVDRVDDYYDLQRRRSSNLIEDFVLETLQNIVENLQDQFSYNDMHDLQKLRQDASETSVFVMDVLNKILQEMKDDIMQAEQQGHTILSNDKHTSTVSLEAEAVVVGALHNIVQEFVGDDEAKLITLNSFRFGDECAKQQVIGTLENLKRDLHDKSNTVVRKAVTEIIQSSMEDECDSCDPYLDNFIETTIDKIIESLNNNRLKPNGSNRHVLSQTSVETDDSVDLILVSTEASEPVLLDGRTISLQKMAEMTSKMIKVHNENIRGSQVSIQDIVGHISGEKVVELLSEAVSKTLSNVETGTLSEQEVHDLAYALSEKYPLETLEGTDPFANIYRSPSSAERVVEEFIMNTLEKIKVELQSGHIDENKMKMAVNSLDSIHKDQEKGTVLKKESSLFSVSSEMLTQLVKNVLSNIVASFDEDSIIIPDDGKIQPVLTKSRTSSISNKSSESNINPNAAKVRWSSKSEDLIEKPLKTTPTPILHSYCDVTNISPKGLVLSIASTMPTNRSNSFPRGIETNSKPTCFVPPQKVVQTSMSKKKSERLPTVSTPQKPRIKIQSMVQSVNVRRSKVHVDLSYRPPLRTNPTIQNGTSSGTPPRSSTQPNRRSIKKSDSNKTTDHADQRSKSVVNRAAIKSEATVAVNKRCVSTETKGRIKSPENRALVGCANMQVVQRLSSPVTRKTSPAGDKPTNQRIKSPVVKEKTSVKSLPSEPMEIRSLCGSHKTKMSVRSSCESDYTERKRTQFH